MKYLNDIIYYVEEFKKSCEKHFAVEDFSSSINVAIDTSQKDTDFNIDFEMFIDTINVESKTKEFYRGIEGQIFTKNNNRIAKIFSVSSYIGNERKCLCELYDKYDDKDAFALALNKAFIELFEMVDAHYEYELSVSRELEDELMYQNAKRLNLKIQKAV